MRMTRAGSTRRQHVFLHIRIRVDFEQGAIFRGAFLFLSRESMTAKAPVPIPKKCTYYRSVVPGLGCRSKRSPFLVVKHVHMVQAPAVQVFFNRIAMCVQGELRVYGLAVLVVREEHDTWSCQYLQREGSNNRRHIPQVVMATPVILRGVNSSPKNQAARVIVDTSLAIPAIDIGITPAR